MIVKKAGKETIKSINKQNILNTFWNREEVARTEVMAKTHLSAATVSSLIQELVEEGLLQECRIGESAGGRRPVMYTLNRTLTYILAMQVTTKGVVTGLVDLSGQIIERQLRPGILHGTAVTDEAIHQAVHSFIVENPDLNEKISAVSFSVPGIIDYQNSTLLYSAALFVENLNLEKIVQEEFQQLNRRPAVYLFRDTDALILGEIACEKNENINMTYLLCENGVGMSFVRDGHLFLGDGFGMELGHTSVDLNGKTCKCGANGCVGTLIGEQPAIKRYIELYEQSNKEWTSDPMFLNYDDIVDLFLEKDPVAVQVLREQLEVLVVVLVNVVNLFNPEWLVLGGPLARLPDIESSVSQAVRRKVLKPFAKDLKIVSSRIGSQAALMGMANYVLKQEIFKSVRF